MTTSRVGEVAPPAFEPQQVAPADDRLIVAGAGGAAVWILTWLAVQLTSAAGWALPLLPGFR